jgi:hypothetical protein
VDIYSDHMVRRYEQSFLPLERIDSTAFMIGNTGTIYYRRTNAWQGMLLLMVARGGWINTIHGNLEFLDEQQARWFAKVQAIYAPLQAMGRTKTFGGIPVRGPAIRLRLDRCGRFNVYSREPSAERSTDQAAFAIAGA